MSPIVGLGVEPLGSGGGGERRLGSPLLVLSHPLGRGKIQGQGGLRTLFFPKQDAELQR